MGIKVGSAKAKGRDFQKAIAKDIRELYGLEERDVVSTPASVPGEDILLSEKAKEVFPFSVECKRTEKASIWSWIKQAEQNKDDRVPIVVFRRSRMKPYVLIDWDNFMRLIK